MILPKNIKTIHFVGIGGVGMSALATVCLSRGYSVTGSDPAAGKLVEKLVSEGAKVFKSHTPSNILGADMVIYSSAITEENLELAAARVEGIPVWHRSELLAAILHDGESIGVTGTHGKTTVSAMTSIVLEAAGVDPTILVGASIPQFGTNAKAGKGQFVVAECDESDRTFLRYNVNHAIITNIEADHLDNYADQADISSSFEQFIRQIKPDGILVLSADDLGVREMLPRLDSSYITYGLFPRLADVRARGIQVVKGGSSFRVEWRGRNLGEIRLQVPGLHNISNALGVITMCRTLGVDFDLIASGLEAFKGVQRRYEIKGVRSGVTVVDDYAHHPTEVAATLNASTSVHSNGRVIAVFQPHRYSRTQQLGRDFGAAFRMADEVLITDVYAAGEKPIEGVSGRLIYDSIKRVGHPNVTFLPTAYEVEQHLLNIVRDGDTVLTLGAGDIWQVGENLLQSLPA